MFGVQPLTNPFPPFILSAAGSSHIQPDRITGEKASDWPKHERKNYRAIARGLPYRRASRFVEPCGFRIF